MKDIDVAIIDAQGKVVFRVFAGIEIKVGCKRLTLDAAVLKKATLWIMKMMPQG